MQYVYPLPIEDLEIQATEKIRLVGERSPNPELDVFLRKLSSIVLLHGLSQAADSWLQALATSSKTMYKELLALTQTGVPDIPGGLAIDPFSTAVHRLEYIDGLFPGNANFHRAVEQKKQDLHHRLTEFGRTLRVRYHSRSKPGNAGFLWLETHNVLYRYERIGKKIGLEEVHEHEQDSPLFSLRDTMTRTLDVERTLLPFFAYVYLGASD